MNNLGRICEWVMRAVVTIVAMVALVAALRSDSDMSNNRKPTRRAAAGPVNLSTDGQAILDIIPDGGSITYAEFQKKAGDDAAKLVAWTQPKTVTRKGNRLIIDFVAPATTTAGGVTISVGSRVEFEVDTNASGLAAKNITGVNVTKGSIGPLPIRRASLSVQSNGNLKVKGVVEISRWLPYWHFDITLGADGQPIP